jgi:hypothetical protein
MINAIDLAKLRNAEFLQFITNFSALVENNTPVTLNVAAQHSALKGKISEIEPLFKQERASAITQELVLLDERRDRAINGLTAVINGFCYHFDVRINKAANLLATNLLLFGAGIAKLSFQAETATINSLISDWETKTDLAAALVTLGLTDWKEELESANSAFDQKFLLRTKEYGATSPETLKLKREESIAIYYELRKYLDANSVLNDSPLYRKAINELNALIEQYNTLLNSRAKNISPTPPVQ